MEEVAIILRWYLALLVMQLIGLGFLQPFFHKWQDKAYGIARFAGLLVAAIPLWFLSSLKLIPFNTTSVVVITLLLTGVSLYLLWRFKFRFNRYMLIQEVLFLLIFVIWSMIRSTNSQVEGTEKFMNLAFMNAINRSEYFPPMDPWYSGEAINYYYLGHYLFTFLGKLAGVTMAYAYNLALTAIIAQTFIGTISVLGEITGLAKKHLKLSLLLGIIIASWLCFGSNLHYAYSYVEQVLFENKTFSYWFPDGTRIIPKVIDEFPAYSITLGDLHGHYMGMPFITMFLGFLFVAFKTAIDSRRKIIMNIFFSLALFSLYGINSWDFITVNYLFLLLHLYQAYRYHGSIRSKIANFLVAQGALLLPGIPLIAPFLINFQPAVSGIGVVPLSTDRPLLPYLQMWGAFLIVNLLGVLSLLILTRIRKLNILKLLKKLIKDNHSSIFALLLTIGALSLILGVEIFYVRDIFEKDNGAYFRTNTVFKFYFAAWNIWAVASGYIVYATIKGIYQTPWKFAFPYLLSVVLVLFTTYIACVSYIAEAVTDYYSFSKFSDGSGFKIAGLIEGKTPVFYKTLNGNDFIAKSHPKDMDMINWFNNNVSGRPVVLEAVGDAYTYYSRISTNTGLPTVLGWPTHQWQWRNKTKEIYGRKDDVGLIYNTIDEPLFLKLVDKYQVEYIVVGEMETKAYASKTYLNLNFITKYFKEVYRSDDSVIYQWRGLE